MYPTLKISNVDGWHQMIFKLCQQPNWKRHLSQMWPCRQEFHIPLWNDSIHLVQSSLFLFPLTCFVCTKLLLPLSFYSHLLNLRFLPKKDNIKLIHLKTYSVIVFKTSLSSLIPSNNALSDMQKKNWLWICVCLQYFLRTNFKSASHKFC